MKTSFTRAQEKLIWGCVISYALAYLCRLNLSATLGSIMESMRVSAARAGMLQTCFAIVYAAGQLINGMLADQINPVRHMLTGLAGTALCNALIGLAGEFWMLPALCLFNGAFQSMLWTPIVRLVALRFPEGPGRVRANFLLSLTLIAGHMGAWSLSGLMSRLLQWRYAYIAPACFVTLMLFPLYLLLRDAEREMRSFSQNGRKTPARSFRYALQCYAQTGFLFILPGCVLYGFARDGIITWAPELLVGISGGNSGLASSISLIIPAVNLLGVLFGYYLRFHGGRNSRITASAMLFLAAAFCLPLFFTRLLPLCALVMGLSCACHYGLTPLLTSLIPMEYDRAGLVGLSAGLTDSFIYVGSALSGAGEGALYQASGAEGLFLSWTVAAVGAGLLLLASRTKQKKMNEASGGNEHG